MAMNVGGAGKAMSDINVTPLVDVMLVLLIIFMVATPLIERERAKKELQENRDKQQRLVQLNLPVLSEKPPQPEDESDVTTVRLRVGANLDTAIGDGETMPCRAPAVGQSKEAWVPCWNAIERVLENDEAAQQYGVTVDAHPRVPFGFVVGVMHRVRRAGIQKVSMMPAGS